MSDSGALPVTVEPADLRYEGEDVVDRVDLDGLQVAVTTHRVLVSTPEGPGRRFRSVYRPNVLGVETGVRADDRAGQRAVKAGIYAIVLLAAGFLVDFDGLVGSVEVSGALGSTAAVIGRLLGLLVLVDDALLVAGLLAGALALAFGFLYTRRRSREFHIEVAGSEPIRLASRPPEGAADRLRSAIRTQ